MIQYILECIAFQLVFLFIYDLFLKRETFFQWNRLYLIVTYAVSLVLPWIKIEALKTTVPEQYFVSPGFLWQMDEITVSPATSTRFLSDMPWYVILLCGGMLLALVFFAYKLYKIQELRNRGDIRHFPNFTQIVIANSSLAFSFFRSIFLGDRVLEKEHEKIIRHELVHIEQRHTLDLLFFELMRIGCWFNPLVYIYQRRISELHEFIADAQVAKTAKKESYQLLLSEVFQTEHISFINQFFKSSLIKKRIVMLQKSRSKRIWKLKYLLLLPITMAMLAYTSIGKAQEVEDGIFVLDEMVLVGYGHSVDDVPNVIEKTKRLENTPTRKGRAFSTLNKVPVFPGCEEAENKGKCFQEKFQKHLSMNFRYPEQARKNGEQGKVYILFTIDEDGNVSNLSTRMREKSSKKLQNEAKRLVASLPKMQPGKYNGKALSVDFSLPVSFDLR